MTRLDRHVATVRTRMTLTSWLRALAWALTAYAVVVWAAILIDKLVQERLPHQAVWFWAGLGVTVVASLVYAIVRRPSQRLAAIAIDEKLALKEKFSTALFVRASNDPFALATVRDAERTADNVTLRRQFPVAVPRAAGGTAVAIVLVFLTAWLLPTFDLFGVQARRTVKAQLAEKEQTQARDAVRRAIKQIEEAPKVVAEKPEIRMALADLKDMRGKPAIDPERASRTAQKAVQDVQQAIKEKIKENKDYAVTQQDFKDFKELAPSPDDQGAMAEAQRKVSEKKFDAAADQLAKAVENFDKMSKADQKKTADQAKTLAQALQKMGSDPKVQQAIQKQLQQMGANQQMAQQMQQMMQQAAAGDKQAQQQLNQAAKQLAQQMNQNSKGSTQQQRQVAQQVQQALQQMQSKVNTQVNARQLAQSAQALAQAMQQAANGQPAQQGQQAQANGQKQGQGQQQTASAAKTGQQGPNGQQASQPGGQNGQQGQQPGNQPGQQPGGQQGQQMADAAKQMQQQLQQMQAVANDANEVAAAQQQQQNDGQGDQGQQQGQGQQANGNGQKQGQNGGAPWQPGNNQQQGQGFGPGGIAAAGGRPAAQLAPFQTKNETDISPRDEKGKVLASTFVKAGSIKGDAKLELHEVLPSADKDAADEVDEQRISRQDAPEVRDYFSTLRKDSEK